MQKPHSPFPPSQKPVALIGYSGHAWVVAEALLSQGRSLAGYCEQAPKQENPFNIPYLGPEDEAEVLTRLKEMDCLVAIGHNQLRRQVTEKLLNRGLTLTRAIHAGAQVSGLARLGEGAFLGPFAVVNAGAEIGLGAICNSASVIEHECRIGSYAHIGPNATLAGGVWIGENTLVGAGAVVLPGVHIGRNAVIGAGSVVLKPVADNQRVAGNPASVLP